MNWIRRAGFVVAAATLVGGAAISARYVPNTRALILVAAPLLGLPFVFRVIVDIASEYGLLPRGTITTGEVIAVSAAGTLLVGSLLYLFVNSSLPGVSLVEERPLYVAFVGEWTLAYVLLRYSIRQSAAERPAGSTDAR